MADFTAGEDGVDFGGDDEQLEEPGTYGDEEDMDVNPEFSGGNFAEDSAAPAARAAAVEEEEEEDDEPPAARAGGANREITHDSRDPERRFCPQCGNMWQPREERTNRTLMLTCRTCGYEEPAHTGKVYENRVIKEVSMRLDAINPEVVQDPTLQRSNQVTCDSCGHNEAVLFQAESGVKASSLSLIFVCCDCGNKWVG
ncbi:hypothetical protein M885DRAFT_456317 [Pelagophyceae sp. CCMP2097]|nr:hypothetical protein M885DRAFT_456317 [Pelagophyceae sp. CCMP2097]